MQQALARGAPRFCFSSDGSAFLTSLGGLLGILSAAASAGRSTSHRDSISLPWYRLLIGLGFGLPGIFFGMYPAFKASRLDPIEALRYE